MFLLRKLALKYNFLISKNIPLIGGLAMGFSFLSICLLVFYINGRLSSEIIGILAASFIMLIFGIIDDWRELSVATKFIVQIICVFVLILFGITTQIIYIGKISNIIITFLWVIGITNAFNHLDITDGLAAGTAVIVSITFLTVAFLNGDINSSILFLTLGTVVLGFLIYNLLPAKIYMGNSGSHFLGFAIAATAILISYAPLEKKVALFSPVLILWFPIFDTAFLMLMRIKQGKSAFRKSDDHLGSRFLKKGYSKNKTLILMLLLCLFFSFCGIVVSQVSSKFGVGIIALVLLSSVYVSIKMNKVSVNG